MKNEPVVELIGLIAVIAGLVFIGLEIRQNNRLAQAAAYQEIGSATAQNWRDMSQDPEFNRQTHRNGLISRADIGPKADDFAPLNGRSAKGVAKLFVDIADSDLKIKFGDGTAKAIVVNTWTAEI